MKKIFCASPLLFFSLVKLPAFAADVNLYVATNKEHYAPAEKVQFQVFLLNPATGTNHTAFVELLDCRGTRLAKKMFPFSYNVSWGEMDLPASAKAEFYLLHCYVVNKDSVQSSCMKKIFISGRLEKQEKGLSFSVFYEGGTFIAESPNNILIRCSEKGSGPVSGKVIDEKKQVYALFETNKQGYAKIKMNPEDKVQYYIVIKDKAGNESRMPLQMAMPSGVTLNAETAQDSITYTLISYTAADKQLPDYRVEAIYNGQLVYDAVIHFQSGLSAVAEKLSRKDLPEGFLVFRLADMPGKIYAQRVIYNPGKTVEGNFISIVDTVNKREIKVELPAYVSGKAYINVATDGINPQPGSSPLFLENTESNSISFNDQLIAAADAPGTFYSPDGNTNRYLSLSGTLLNNEKKPLKNKDLTLVIVHKNLKKQFLAAKTDKEGKMRIDNLVFFDSVTLYYQLADKSAGKNDVFLDLKVNPSLNDPLKEPVAKNFVCATEPASESNSPAINTDEKTLQQVVLTAKNEKTESEKFSDKYVSGQMKRSNALRNEYDFIKDPVTVDNVSVFEFIRGRFPGLKIQTDRDGTPYISGSSGGTVGVYLNDMELDSNLSSIASLQVKDVAQIKYYSMSFKPKAVWRDMLRDIKAPDAGDLLIYTKRDYMPDDKTKGLPKAVLTGYDLEKPVLTSAMHNSATGSLYWQPGWDVESNQTIYVDLPAGKTEINALLIIEGINNVMAPYRFTKNLVFN